jgi:hypothetical protein
MASPIFPSKILAVVEQYLAGQASLEQAARELSSILGSVFMHSTRRRSLGALEGPRHSPPRTLRIRPIPPERVVQWLGLGSRPVHRRSDVTLGLGGSLADQAKVKALFLEAVSHLSVWHHIWRRFGRDAA